MNSVCRCIKPNSMEWFDNSRLKSYEDEIERWIGWVMYELNQLFYIEIIFPLMIHAWKIVGSLIGSYEHKNHIITEHTEQPYSRERPISRNSWVNVRRNDVDVKYNLTRPWFNALERYSLWSGSVRYDAAACADAASCGTTKCWCCVTKRWCRSELLLRLIVPWYHEADRVWLVWHSAVLRKCSSFFLLFPPFLLLFRFWQQIRNQGWRRAPVKRQCAFHLHGEGMNACEGEQQ